MALAKGGALGRKSRQGRGSLGRRENGRWPTGVNSRRSLERGGATVAVGRGGGCRRWLGGAIGGVKWWWRRRKGGRLGDAVRVVVVGGGVGCRGWEREWWRVVGWKGGGEGEVWWRWRNGEGGLGFRWEEELMEKRESAMEMGFSVRRGRLSGLVEGEGEMGWWLVAPPVVEVGGAPVSGGEAGWGVSYGGN